VHQLVTSGLNTFQKHHNADCHSELLKTAEFFFCIPGHNANVERVFFLMNTQGTGEQNRFTTKATEGVSLLQYNLHDFSCLQFYKFLLEQPTVLRDIKSSNKYAVST
jgi:hypothetical protein